MKTISSFKKDVITLAGNDGRYHSFPDVAVLPDRRLFAVWREADSHVASESRLLISYGTPDGGSWNKPAVLHEGFGHMPRVTVTPAKVYIIDDGAPPPTAYPAESSLFVSDDGGNSFRRIALDVGDARTIPDAPCFAPDKILVLADGTLACAAQIRLGSRGHRDDHTFCNLLYRSEDGGATWFPGTVLAVERGLKLCEPSLCRVPDGRLLAMYRVNAHPAEHTRFHFGDADGYEWDALREAPFFGHRPTAGFLSDGRLLVTYRKVSAPRAVCAWVGTLADLAADGGTEYELLPAPTVSPGDMGYSGWVETAPGRIVCVAHHREPEEEHSVIRTVRFDV